MPISSLSFRNVCFCHPMGIRANQFASLRLAERRPGLACGRIPLAL